MKRIGGVTEKSTNGAKLRTNSPRNQQHGSAHCGGDVIVLNGGAGGPLGHRIKTHRIVVPK